MLAHELKHVARCVQGLCHYLPGKSEQYGMPRIIVRHDRDRERDNKKQARAMACASIGRDGIPIIGVCTNLANIAMPFMTGVLIHELTHLAFNLMGDPRHEVEVDATILALVPEARYRYDDISYHDRVLGKERRARNLQRVDEEFAGFCMGWWADKCSEGRVIIR